MSAIAAEAPFPPSAGNSSRISFLLHGKASAWCARRCAAGGIFSSTPMFDVGRPALRPGLAACSWCFSFLTVPASQFSWRAGSGPGPDWLAIAPPPIAASVIGLWISYFLDPGSPARRSSGVLGVWQLLLAMIIARFLDAVSCIPITNHFTGGNRGAGGFDRLRSLQGLLCKLDVWPELSTKGLDPMVGLYTRPRIISQEVTEETKGCRPTFVLSVTSCKKSGGSSLGGFEQSGFTISSARPVWGQIPREPSGLSPGQGAAQGKRAASRVTERA